MNLLTSSVIRRPIYANFIDPKSLKRIGAWNTTSLERKIWPRIRGQILSEAIEPLDKNLYKNEGDLTHFLKLVKYIFFKHQQRKNPNQTQFKKRKNSAGVNWFFSYSNDPKRFCDLILYTSCYGIHRIPKVFFFAYATNLQSYFECSKPDVCTKIFSKHNPRPHLSEYCPGVFLIKLPVYRRSDLYNFSLNKRSGGETAKPPV